MAQDKYIRFDWAAKTVLRDKANFCILEGLISVLLGETVTIVELLESESNQKQIDDKFNRVDIKARNSNDEIIIVEIQQTREIFYLERILYGVAKAITEHIHLGNKYNQVKKVYSINILYFDLGKGDDYIYRGQTSFTGVNKKDTLQITTKEKDVIQMRSPKEVFPEYYLIRVNAFNKIAENHMEEWMRYFKDGEIDENTTAPGLKEAKRKLEYLQMSKAEKHAYDEHLNAIMIQNDVISTAQKEGRAEGRAEGIAIGEARERMKAHEEKLASARSFKALGALSNQQIAQALGLSITDVEKA
ncbi:MAG: Rpn family recombination-promoting nuclease/putative transposase [Bacteroidaceae bacterium]|nr:Rpn family recombination-promoting nuclease/putative transposase [Bacteroidaceae bacterium]